MKVLRNNTAVVSVFLIIALTVLSGCGSGPGSDGLEKKNGVSLNLTWPSNYSFDASTSQLSSTSSPKMMAAPAYVTGCRVTVSGADMSPLTLDVPLSTGQVSGSVTPGERHFSVVVDTDIGLSFTGSTSATLVPGNNGVISISLSVNSPPEFSGISVSDSSPKKRETVTLTATVSDEDSSDRQTFTWDGGGGSISGSGSSVGWSAAHSGSYTVTVAVNDGHGGVVRGSAVINVTNTRPTINYVTVDKTAVVVGDVVNLDCSASDADGDRLSYIWSDGHGWVASGATSRYAVKSTAVHTLTCEVDDGDSGRASGSVRITATGGSSTVPTGVTAVGGNAQATVSWNPVAGATSYNLYWSSTSPVTTASAKIAGVTSPHSHTGLTNGATYYYAVTAVDSSGESALSAEVSATPQALVVIPTPPANVTAVGGNAQVTVSWNASAGATSYNLYWSPTSPVTTASAKIAGVTFPRTHTGLTNGATYYYAVTAVNQAGESPLSAQVSATPQAVIVIPLAPTGVTAAGGDAQATVSWNASAGATSYNLYWNTLPGVTIANSVPILGIPASPFIHSPLTNGATYYYRVTAVNSAGESGLSPEVSATPQPVGVTTVEGHVQYGNALFISGVTVQLFGQASWGGGVASTIVTDANGFYSFTGVAYPVSFDSTYLDLLNASIPNPPYNGVTWGCSVANSIATCDFYLAKPASVFVSGDNTTVNLIITVTPPTPAVSCDAYITQGPSTIVSSGTPSGFTGAWIWSLTNPVSGMSPGFSYSFNYHCYDSFSNVVSYSVTPTSFVY